METAASPLSYCRIGSTTAVRVCGRATFPIAPAARRFVEDCLSQGAPEVQLDLADCSHIDSTFLGTLLALKRLADRRRPPCRLTVRGLSLPCRQVLRQAGLDQLFPSAEGAPATCEWTPVPAQRGATGELQEQMVVAHQALAQLPGPAGEQFRPIAARLEAEFAEGKPRE